MPDVTTITTPAVGDYAETQFTFYASPLGGFRIALLNNNNRVWIDVSTLDAATQATITALLQALHGDAWPSATTTSTPTTGGTT